MSYPLEERHKNLEQRVADLEETNFAGHSMRDEVLHGVIRKVHLSGNKSSAGCTLDYIEVCPFLPFNNMSKQDGTLIFDQTNKDPLNAIDDGTAFRKVYCLNVPPILLRLFFRPGEVINYWRYTGTAQVIGERGNEGNPDYIRGSFVTRVEDWSFIATVKFSSTAGGLHRYAFTAYEFDANNCNDDVTCHWQKYKPCSSASAFSSTECYNLNDANGSSGSPIADGSFVRVYRFYNNDAGSGDIYEYWFMPVGGSGSGILDIRYSADVGYIQATYDNSTWVNKIQVDECSATSVPEFFSF